ncbi:MAG: GNAT family N-acetyltransferase, partial [Anaerolineae bacterium]|nr:GNAT family N-acetyltransferase [Anaerolineae bacterium]
MTRLNHLGQPISFAVPDWTPPPVPPREPLIGRYCRVEPLEIERHADDLYAAYSTADDDRNWTYPADGPFDSLAS